MMEYKGYIGKVEFDDEAEIFHGEIINVRDVITFQGDSVAGLRKAFRGSVDDYLAFCQERGESPEKPYSGQFVTRIPPELHRRVNVAAIVSGKSLNAWVTEQLQTAVQGVVFVKVSRKKVAAKAKAATVRRKRAKSS
jgi:predicted HicB family RNase H-like nuclease